jgi:tetratricopeptide (TPR) repeat protein
VAIAPDDIEAWRDLGTCLALLTRYREASEAWAQVERLNPDADSDVETREILSDFGGKVLSNVRIADSDLDASSLPQVAQAYVCMRKGDYGGAAAAFDRALALDPDRVDLLGDRGICAEVLEGPAQAIAFFDRGLALAPDDVRTWYNRGVSLRNLERTEEAAAAFDQAVKLHEAQDVPPDADLIHAHHNLASCLILLGRLEDALDSLDEVAQLTRRAPGEWHEEARRAEELKGLLFGVGR